MHIESDPENRLRSLENVINEYERTIAAKTKDKTVEISVNPAKYYLGHSQDYTASMSYYNKLLNTECPGDIPMELSAEIRKKRSEFYLQMSKLVMRIQFG